MTKLSKEKFKKCIAGRQPGSARRRRTGGPFEEKEAGTFE